MALTTAQVFGEFTENFSERSEFLVLGFSPSSLPIQLRWRTNGLSADFLGDYVKNFFPGDTRAALNKQTEVRHAVSFVANELLENAMKYSDKGAGQPVNLELHLFSDHLIFVSKNSVHQDAIADFQTYLQQITTSDIGEMYINQVEKSSDNDESKSSGLGYLTMIMDYDAVLGWKLEQISNTPAIIVTTMVQLPL
ncbi:MAG: ATP-binding protein [Pseudanabaena sp. M135S2SP2A07QC]|nr:ATP-binding protein [Pseudanabaena sp. M090S1SP2A07QC]MCA6506795.1 ATP-binding protein [Pseudanabaena sp. M172S2SP2A07QC]MCA6523553.1 ATP-binding protein [Pseudanabaena sp. M051S1SP2A07QC]MCA6527974.1 ATP-binding protein [Pseudanabaena sp. M179S2SP2A07QC]MCA6528702.1 ATP-binding protein [Pseudanabaena sp. M125S2SP2A07QC]MCA6535658.1 ATP-binding protein [Pseudanabaena sp. M176S2SP2A07QC]MCA6540088.1 ATP-binding protein [Pseudanabaena sp. M037S2SP2A07QC]MCA6541712.1 ATP-binding protein [Pse